MTHLIPKNIAKFFRFTGAYSHKRTRKLTTRQHKAFHTKQFAEKQGYKKVVPHEHKYFDTRTKKKKIRWEEYSDKTV